MKGKLHMEAVLTSILPIRKYCYLPRISREVPVVHHSKFQCCGAGPFLTGSGSRYFFFTGSGSFSYKNRLKSSKKHVFAFTSLHRLRPKSTGSDRLRLRNTDHRITYLYGLYRSSTFDSLTLPLSYLSTRLPSVVFFTLI